MKRPFILLVACFPLLLPPQTTLTTVDPFNLVWSKVDPNNLPANPEWAYRLLHNDVPNPNGPPCNGFKITYPGPFGLLTFFTIYPGCVSQPVTWMPDGTWCGGHLNWQVVEYEGALYWDVNDGHSSPFANDDDYNFWLAPVGLTTLTTNSQTLQLEFKAGETIDHFHTPWWTALKSYVDAGGGTEIDTDYANVIGVLGLDCQHSCSTEIHPVMAMAIHDNVRRSPDDDVWAIFVRNWGDEGFCASGEILAQNLTSLTFHLPWRQNATRVTGRSDNSVFLYGPDSYVGTPAGNQVTGPYVQPDRANGYVAVGFTLPAPISAVEPGVRINGELHLRWEGPGLTDPCASIRSRVVNLMEQLNQLSSGLPAIKAENPAIAAHAEQEIRAWHAQHDPELRQLQQQLASCENRRNPHETAVEIQTKSEREEVTPEKSMNASFEKLPLKEQQTVSAQLLLFDRASDDSHPVPIPPTGQSMPVKKGVAVETTSRITVVANPIKQENDRRQKQVLCKAFNNHLKDFSCF